MGGPAVLHGRYPNRARAHAQCQMRRLPSVSLFYLGVAAAAHPEFLRYPSPSSSSSDSPAPGSAPTPSPRDSYLSTSTATYACHDRVVVGVDYYPEQWPLEDLKPDMHSIKHDLGADMIRIGEFMWHELEPENNRFNFTFLDLVVQLAEDLNLEIMLGTPTATMPAWLAKEHPEVLLKGPDSADGFEGASAGFGGRRQYSFNSLTYRRYTTRLVARLAERYGHRSIVTFWQVDNELGHEGSDLDFSRQSLLSWRMWLDSQYNGNIQKLNEDWGTVFWGVTYNSFDEIPLPRWTIPGGPGRWNQNFRSNQSPGMLLDFRRFRRDSVTDFSNSMVAILRRAGIKGCITTNAPGGFWGKAMDHNDIFKSMDIPAYDNYAVWGGSTSAPQASSVAMILDVVRGWAQPGKHGWMVAEQLIGAQGHDIIGYTPRPGQVKAWSTASLLHGAIGLNFFRYRAAVFGQEEFCYGILDHTTPRGTGRKWKETKEVYGIAKQHEELWLAPIEAKVALIYDAENIFAWQAQPQSTNFWFENEAHRLYRPFWRNGVAIDAISTNRLLSMGDATELLKRYRILLLPVPMVTSDELVDFLAKFVESGGTLWVSFRADLKDKRSQMRRVPSRLAALAGVVIEEIESLNPGVSDDARKVKRAGDKDDTWVDIWREGLLQLAGINSTNDSKMEVLFSYTDNFFGELGYGAVARKRSLHNSSEVLYLGAGIDPEALLDAAAEALERQDVEKVGIAPDGELERVLRRDRQGNVWEVQINHNIWPVDGTQGDSYLPFEVRILKQQQQQQAPPQALLN